MVRMNEARIYVDLNEHVDGDIFLLRRRPEALVRATGRTMGRSTPLG